MFDALVGTTVDWEIGSSESRGGGGGEEEGKTISWDTKMNELLGIRIRSLEIGMEGFWEEMEIRL